MLKRKMIISLSIFTLLFVGAWVADGMWNHFNHFPWKIPESDVRILHHNEHNNDGHGLNHYHENPAENDRRGYRYKTEPFGPREYIRVYPKYTPE